MSTSKTFHCIVDDTALITSVEEIESWITHGVLELVIPLHTIERLHLLKKDSSQIGQNARKAVKLLDDITSDTKLAAAVVIQEAEERYTTWAEVEEHYVENTEGGQKGKQNAVTYENEPHAVSELKDNSPPTEERLSKMLRTKLTTAKEPNANSPLSTPPLSPSSSGPQSSKTSPEVKTASVIANDMSPVPPSLKDLINSVVWYTYEKEHNGKDLVFLTNSSDTGYLARDFGVTSKTIHQLRASIGILEQEIKKATLNKVEKEPRTLFRYEDNESEDEEVVFKPRGRGAARTVVPTRGNNSGSVRSKTGHSPANSLSAPTQATQNKPQIPIEEIDPDSFDRGSFGRGSIPLASVGNHVQPQFAGVPRGQTPRGNFVTGGHSRGAHRGGSRGNGSERGATRGRGRLFVP